MRRLCVVFARAPRLGAVKRRLAREVGDRAALRFHRATAERLLRVLARDRRFETVLAVTPDGARWPRVPVRRVGQGRGDLGMRMHRACARVRRGAVVIVGSDIPGADADDVAAAFRALGAADAVFGPALDGGYWLVGLGPRRPAQPFAGARWSSEHALADTLANFRGRRVALLRALRDVDTAGDLDAARAAARVGTARPLNPRSARALPGRVGRGGRSSMVDQVPDVPGGPHLRTVAMPRDTNPSGAIFGGWTVSQMDLAGGTFAAQRAGGRVVTSRIEAMRFLRPVAVGDEVSCYCSVEHEDGASVAVKIETWARGRTGGDPEKVTEGVFTYVAVGEDGKPREIAGAGAPGPG